jgi:hypothetical protein
MRIQKYVDKKSYFAMKQLTTLLVFLIFTFAQGYSQNAFQVVIGNTGEDIATSIAKKET